MCGSRAPIYGVMASETRPRCPAHDSRVRSASHSPRRDAGALRGHVRGSPRELDATALGILRDGLLGQQLTLGRLSRGITDQTGSSPHERNRHVPGPLEMDQAHDRDQASDVQATRRGIEADVAHPASPRQVIGRTLRGILQEAAPLLREGGDPEPEVRLQGPPHRDSSVDVAVEAHQGRLPAVLSEEPVRQPGALVGRAQVAELQRDAPDARFDLILHFFVLEHIADPGAFLKAQLAMLKPGGRIVFEIPNAADPLYSVYDIPAFERFYWSVAHPWYFSEPSLQFLLTRLGESSEVLRDQRYDLSNHMIWARDGRPGGMGRFTPELGADVEASYKQSLIRSGKCDTLVGIIRKDGGA